MAKFVIRCDKNGDGKLSEEEVKEVWTETPKVLLIIFSSCVYSLSLSLSVFSVFSENFVC